MPDLLKEKVYSNIKQTKIIIPAKLQTAGGRFWPKFLKALAKRTRKSTQVFDLRSACVSFGHPLVWLATHLRRLRSSSNLDASRRTLSQFGHPTQVDTSWSKVNWICIKFTAVCDLRELASRLANPFGRPGASPYASSGFANLGWLASNILV